MQIDDILASYDFGRHPRIVDLGGGEGHLWRAIVRHVDAVGVFDQQAVVAAARSADSDERLSFAAGDFSTPLPSGDLVILQEVLRDWDGDRCRQILAAVSSRPNRSCRPDLGNRGRNGASLVSAA